MSGTIPSTDRKPIQRGWKTFIVEIVLAMSVLIISATLLTLSANSGVDRYQAGTVLLDRTTISNARLDTALLSLMQFRRVDLDQATELQAEFRSNLKAARSFWGELASTRLRRAGNDKLDSFERFKAHHAIVRNSRAIGTEMLQVLSGRDGPGWQQDTDLLNRLEKLWLTHAVRQDVASLNAISDAIIVAEASQPSLVERSEWKIFTSHAQAIQEHEQLMRAEADKVFSGLVPDIVYDLQAGLDETYARDRQQSVFYRIALFALILLLIIYSVRKVLQVSTYVQLLQRARGNLEARVRARTEDLTKANRALETQIEERERMEGELRMAQKLESIGQLAAGIAHEINTPAQYVGDNIRFLSSSWDDLESVMQAWETDMENDSRDNKSIREAWNKADVPFLRDEVPVALREATSGVDQIAQIVRAMKEFSHPGDESLRPIDINHTIENIVTVARNEWKYVADIDFDFDVNIPSVPCNVSGLNQVILNLIVNAAQAIADNAENGEKGVISIQTRQDADWVRVVIEDNGPGIPESIRSRVFDPFFTTKEVGSGTGQGLAIAYRIVTEQHRGSISVTPGSDDRGARFTIELPVRSDAVADDMDAANDQVGAADCQATASG